MKLVLTLMVRDEVDIIAAMIEHHLDQGADLVIATDNGSVDGTAEVLQSYADLGLVELFHDPVHRKQQRSLVTKMARRAFTEHHADWVINADADEFFVPVDRSLTLRETLDRVPRFRGAFPAPVFNMIGPPAERGAGLTRLVWRDVRPPDVIQQLGILAHPTSNAVHRGDADVVVQQGNHFVSIAGAGPLDAGEGVEVYHFPWRSTAQLERRTINTGTSYEANPDLKPSPNHHGMADWRRYQEGTLRDSYLLRLPPADDVPALEAAGELIHDEWLSDRLQRLVATARRPDLLRACLEPFDEHVVPVGEHRAGVVRGRAARVAEIERRQAEAEAAAGDKMPQRPGRTARLRTVRRRARQVNGRARRGVRKVSRVVARNVTLSVDRGLERRIGRTIETPRTAPAAAERPVEVSVVDRSAVLPAPVEADVKGGVQ